MKDKLKDILIAEFYDCDKRWHEAIDQATSAILRLVSEEMGYKEKQRLMWIRELDKRIEEPIKKPMSRIENEINEDRERCRMCIQDLQEKLKEE